MRRSTRSDRLSGAMALSCLLRRDNLVHRQDMPEEISRLVGGLIVRKEAATLAPVNPPQAVAAPSEPARPPLPLPRDTAGTIAVTVNLCLHAGHDAIDFAPAARLRRTVFCLRSCPFARA